MSKKHLNKHSFKTSFMLSVSLLTPPFVPPQRVGKLSPPRLRGGLRGGIRTEIIKYYLIWFIISISILLLTGCNKTPTEEINVKNRENVEINKKKDRILPK